MSGISAHRLSTGTERRTTSIGFVALAVGAVAVLTAAGLLAWSSVTTAQGRFAGTTGTQSLLTAAVVDLSLGIGEAGTASDLVVDGAGLYPGKLLQRCVVVNYFGSATAPRVRMFTGQPSGRGLDRFLDTQVTLGRGTDPDCADFNGQTPVFTGTLADLAARHPSFDEGIEVLRPVSEAASVTVRFALDVISDNRAQGLDTEIVVTLEVRP